jgi:hypothetical protein
MQRANRTSRSTSSALAFQTFRGILADARSYAERLFEYVRIDRLPEKEAAIALTRPAEEEHVERATDALDVVLTASRGYPYFLQEYGKAAWDTASRTPINADDATEGVRIGKARLDGASFSPVGNERLQPRGITSQQWLSMVTGQVRPGKSRAGCINRIRSSARPEPISSRKGSCTRRSTGKSHSPCLAWPSSLLDRRGPGAAA